MTKKVGLKDIAERVGVSTALVSYVLNNKKEGRIKKSVAEHIKRVAVDLNYRTNQIARSLKTNKTYTIGLVIGDIANPFFAHLARIIEDEAEVHNYTVLFGSSDEKPQRARKLIETFIDRQVDGIIFAPGEHGLEQVSQLQQQRIPFVLVDRYFPALNTNYVAIDNYTAAYDAVDHLIATGYRRIAMIAFHSRLFHMNERIRGYQSALQHHGLPLLPSRLVEINVTNNPREVTQALDQLIAAPDPADAVLFATNAIATHGLRHVNHLQLKVPQQLALVSFDKSDALDLFYAPITYIDQPLLQIGQLATSNLIAMIEGNAIVKQYNLPAKLVVRASTLRS